MTGADGRAYSFTYNNEGRLTAKTASGYSQTYSWNALGELIKVKTGSDSVMFGYDAEGRRVRKTHAGTTTYYVWDGEQLAMQLDGSGNRTFEYSYQPGGLDAPVAVKSGSSTYYYQLDETGSVAAVWNASNNTVATYTYDPYGYTVDSSGTLTQNLRWKGAQYDTETGLYYMRARYYDPTVGRFISEDPAGLAGGINPYTYGNGEPVNASDPTGLAANGDCTAIWLVTSVNGVELYRESLGTFGNGCANLGGPSLPGGGGTQGNQQKQQQHKQCKNVPPAPTGASATYDAKLVQEATKGMWVPGTQSDYFLQLFITGGPFDYKSRYGSDQYIDYGNWHYGYVCASTFSALYCQSAAGINRMYRAARSLHNPLGSGVPFLKQPFGDQAVDNAWVRKGFVAYQSGCVQ